MIKIDEEKCNGCGECVPTCEEGALQVIDGKARVVSESYCDGLGACLGHCPQGALTLHEAKTVPFDEEAAMEHVRKTRSSKGQGLHDDLVLSTTQTDQYDDALVPVERKASKLEHWPVKLRLVSPQHPALKETSLLVVADCTSLAYAGLHEDFISGRSVLIACPKFENYESNTKQLALIMTLNNIKDVTVMNMEVPCCGGLKRMVKDAVFRSGKKVPFRSYTISARGHIKSVE